MRQGAVLVATPVFRIYSITVISEGKLKVNLRREIKKEWMHLDDKEFTQLAKNLQVYLEREKTFAINPLRMEEFERGVSIARELFPDGQIEIKDDPLQMGAKIMCVDDTDILMRGEREINLFCEMISLADNFEIYPVSENTIRFSAVFQNALTNIG